MCGVENMSLRIIRNDDDEPKHFIELISDNAEDDIKLKIIEIISTNIDKELKTSIKNNDVIYDKNSLKYVFKKSYNDFAYPKISDKVKKEVVTAIDGLTKIDDITNPDYYNKNGLSPIDAFRNGLLSKEEYIGFLKGNIIKYSVRCDSKNLTEDMEKCKTYAEYLKEVLQDAK